MLYQLPQSLFDFADGFAVLHPMGHCHVIHLYVFGCLIRLSVLLPAAFYGFLSCTATCPFRFPAAVPQRICLCFFQKSGYDQHLLRSHLRCQVHMGFCPVQFLPVDKIVVLVDAADFQPCLFDFPAQLGTAFPKLGAVDLHSLDAEAPAGLQQLRKLPALLLHCLGDVVIKYGKLHHLSPYNVTRISTFFPFRRLITKFCASW